MKKRLRKFLGEMIPVVVGILIALVINNWQESANDRKFVRKILTNITHEMTENEAELEDKIAEHQILMDTITAHLDDEEVMIGDLINQVNGIRMVSIKNMAWKSFLNTKMELIDYSLVSTLTDIDGLKQAMEVQTKKIMDFVYENLASNETSKKQVFLMIIGDLQYSEEQLLEDHQMFLDMQKID